MLSSRALVICNGEPPSAPLIRRMARAVGYVVAADGGANNACRAGVRPDVIIGDLDSVKSTPLRACKGATVLRVARQDNTDLEKALDYLVSRKITEATILGATGRRIDFTLANLSVFWRYQRNLQVTFMGDGWRATPAGRKLSIEAEPGVTVSLIPFGNCSGITLRGLVYSLKNAPLRMGGVAVSNVVRSSPFTVEVRRGNMLVVVLDHHRSASTRRR